MEHKVLRSTEFLKFLQFLYFSLIATLLKQGIDAKHDAKCLVATEKKFNLIRDKILGLEINQHAKHLQHFVYYQDVMSSCGVTH